MKKKHLRPVMYQLHEINKKLNDIIMNKGILITEDEFFALIRISGAVGKKEPLTGDEIAKSLSEWKKAMQNKDHKV